ncbi:MAG: tetratricopeptide repeat protein [Candidatus Eisenbacteria bacterium]
MKRAHLSAIGLVLLLACASQGGLGDPFHEIVFEERAPLSEKDPYAYYLLARFQEDKGRLEDAIRSYEETAQADPGAVDVLARLAGLHLQRRDFDRAVSYAERAVAVDPTREDALGVLAKAYLESGRAEEAIARFETLAETEEDGTIRFLLSMLYQSRGEEERAIENLERAALLAPERAFYQVRIGDFRRHRGEHDLAEKAYREAIRLAENDAPIRAALARMYADAERWEDAAAEYEKLAADGYRPFDIHHRLVGVYLRLGRGEDAIRNAEVLAEIDPSNMKLRAELGDLYLSLGREREGIAALEAAWKADPGEPGPARRLVEVHLAAERFEEAEALLRELLAHDGEDSWAWARLSYARLRLGDEEESLRAIERAAAIDPTNGGIHYLLGNTYLLRGRLEEALEHFTLAFQGGIESVDLYYKKANLEAQFGKEEEAIRTLRALLPLDPDHPQSLNLLGYLLAVKGRDLDEAERLILRALEHRPGNPFFRDSLGWLYFRKGDLARAIRELEEAREGLKEDPTVLEHLADAYAAAGRREEAARAYRGVLLLEEGNEEALRKLRALEER